MSKYHGKSAYSYLEIFQHTYDVLGKNRHAQSPTHRHQIFAVLKFVEAGRTVKAVCSESSISKASYYNWKEKLSGMENSDIKR